MKPWLTWTSRSLPAGRLAMGMGFPVEKASESMHLGAARAGCGKQGPVSLTYDQSGVDYDTLDAFKRACQRAAAGTTGALALHGLSEPPRVRGESAYLLETPTGYLAH